MPKNGQHLRNSSYGLIEVKLGGDKLIEEGAENLKKLKPYRRATGALIIVELHPPA